MHVHLRLELGLQAHDRELLRCGPACLRQLLDERNWIVHRLLQLSHAVDRLERSGDGKGGSDWGSSGGGDGMEMAIGLTWMGLQ